MNAPRFTSHPTPQTVDLAQTATFKCHAVGYNVKYKWNSGNGSFPCKVTSINTNALEIPDVRSSDDNTYYCTISNDGGTIRSIEAKLTVIGMSVKLLHTLLHIPLPSLYMHIVVTKTKEYYNQHNHAIYTQTHAKLVTEE